MPGGVGGGERPHVLGSGYSSKKGMLLHWRRSKDALGSKFYHVSEN